MRWTCVDSGSAPGTTTTLIWGLGKPSPGEFGRCEKRFLSSQTTHKPRRPARTPETRSPAPLRGEKYAGGGKSAPGSPLTPPSTPALAHDARPPESSCPEGWRRCTARRGAPLHGVAPRPAPCPPSFGAAKTLSPRLWSLQRANESGAGFGAPGPSERGHRGACPQRAPAPRPVSWVAARGERQPWLDHGVCGQGAGPGGGGGGELTAGWSLRLRAHWELRQPARALRRTADAAEGERDPRGAVLNVRGQRPVLWKTRGRCPNLGESGGNAQISWTREKHCPRPSGHAAGPSVLGEQRESSQIRGAEAWEELRRRPRKAWNRCPLCTGLEEVRRAAGGPGAIAQISASTRQSSDLRAERMCVPK